MVDHVIIAGSEKCGTTSLFQYLSDSKEFNVSRVKETDYFRKKETLSYQGYLNEFVEVGSKCTLEASPGYLSDSERAAENIKNLLQGKRVKLVFCVRDPVQRLISSFLFHKSRLYLDKDMVFSEYVELCFLYENGQYTPKSDVEEWCLKVLRNGRYYSRLQPFIHLFDKSDIMLVSATGLANNTRAEIDRFFKFVGTPTPAFYDNYTFNKSNVTAGFKNKGIQAFALKINKRFERFWLKNPGIKRVLMSIYAVINGKEKEAVKITHEVEAKLKSYYMEDAKSFYELSGIKLF